MSKITLTIEHVDPKHPNASAMAQTIGLLAQLVDLPSNGFKLTLQCADEDLTDYAGELEQTLAHRPVGIKVKMKQETEDEIERSTLASVTPMDQMWRN